jgi:hypothetical protein
LPKSTVRATLTEVSGSPLVVMTIARPDELRQFPSSARLSLILDENKGVEVLDFGTIARPHGSAAVRAGFVAPSCQLRVVDPGVRAKGLLLASTDSWTLKGANDLSTGGRGILNFQPYPTAPQSWKLKLQPSDHPIVLVDERIPSVRAWVRDDPVFRAMVLPAVISRVLDYILTGDAPDDEPWVGDWLAWANSLVAEPPPDDDDDNDQARPEWVDKVVDAFCRAHGFSDALVTYAGSGDGA